MKSIPHPIQYQGSKRNLAAAILGYFPKDVDRLIEPFAGSAAISIAAAARQLAARYAINDVNKPLVELLRLMVEQPTETADYYEQIWNGQLTEDSPSHYYQMRDAFNRSQDPRLFLYLLARCVKGAVRYNADGMFNQSPDKRRKGTRPATMRNNIFGVSALLQGKSAFSALDYRDVLRTVTTDDLVYMDPPYQGVCGEHDSRYLSGIDHHEFVLALEELNERGIAYVVSYDGRRGDKAFGELLPSYLELSRIELLAGRSSQSTLLGRTEMTYESLYLSPVLVQKRTLPALRSHAIPIQPHYVPEANALYA
ncbi:Dam family site-specific DNA-(adenine-N6)-methyltransferase [Thiothrix winogradskyi]|uniref:Site-specific DNA-methyltransferase (adenine-specific) n=1 Tax=Thiothrix winogradskyi TaxID=96472 RepID=A0ABY3T0R5_9GAMM|nr:Dam family site-specific DNA-(adenine-N6)-methyltransferase [Thiothrix winogradskyi]UJS25393.1 Dam family site-specific DNA-(adenine-N6)-methyltransferase [Thiothrix winogradskyi]